MNQVSARSSARPAVALRDQALFGRLLPPVRPREPRGRTESVACDLPGAQAVRERPKLLVDRGEERRPKLDRTPS